MNDEQPVQKNLLQEIDLTSKVTAFQIYDLTIGLVIEENRYEAITQWNIKNDLVNVINMRAPPHYHFFIVEMVKSLKHARHPINHKNLGSALVTLGLSKIQHRHYHNSKKLSDIRTQLSRIDAPRAVELFGNGNNELFEYARGKFGRDNIHVDSAAVAAPLYNLKEFLGLGASAMATVCCAEAFLTWSDLPETAKPMFQYDIGLFEEHVSNVLELGESIEL